LTFGVLAAVAASSSTSNDVAPGVLGFLVVAAMGVALVFLLRSMNKQFRKITPNPADPPGGPAKPETAGQEIEGSAGSSPPGQHHTAPQETSK
jgi:hypothetical protein